MSKEFQRMQQLAGLLTEIRITPVIQQFKEFEKYPNWLYFNAPNGTEFEGSPMIDTDSQYVTPASSNSVMFEISLLHTNPKGYEGIQQMINYLEKFNIKYNISNFNHNDFKDTYISVDLDDLKKQHLIKKVKKDINEIRIAPFLSPKFSYFSDISPNGTTYNFVTFTFSDGKKGYGNLEGNIGDYEHWGGVSLVYPNPVLFLIPKNDTKAIEDLTKYLRINDIKYKVSTPKDSEDETYDAFSFSLDELEKKHLIKKD